MPGRRWSDGLHQAVEAKEKVKIERENQTLATVTFQNYFRKYGKLSGMTGTADTETEEFAKIYKLDVMVIPTNRELRRIEEPDTVYRTAKEKFDAIVGDILEKQQEGRPVLVGTVSIEKSERLSTMLKRRGIRHVVLNAKYHAQEAEIVAQAGRKDAVTIATNMAGRRTDILLGGNAEYMARQQCLGEEVAEKLPRGAGRQGDPGSSRFYLSLEDDLMRIFGSDRISGLMQRLGMEEGVPIEHKMVTRAIERAQKQVEAQNFSVRKHLLEYDDVMNKQRESIYALRRELLEGQVRIDEDETVDTRGYVMGLAEDLLDDIVERYIGRETDIDAWDVPAFKQEITRVFGFAQEDFAGIDFSGSTDEIRDATWTRIQAEYEQKEALVGRELLQRVERDIMLQIVDGQWKDHLYSLDHLKEGIGLRGYGQRDPLVEYKRESFELFQAMRARASRRHAAASR